MAFAMMPVLGQVYADDYVLYADAVSDKGVVYHDGDTVEIPQGGKVFLEFVTDFEHNQEHGASKVIGFSDGYEDGTLTTQGFSIQVGPGNELGYESTSFGIEIGTAGLEAGSQAELLYYVYEDAETIDFITTPHAGDWSLTIRVVESGEADPYDLGNSVVTFDSKYHVLEDIASTPYEDWFYVVPSGTVLEPIVMLGDRQLSSDCYSASYSECMFYTERNEWDKIDENAWIDHFPTDVGVYFCKVEGKGDYHGTFEWIDLIRIEKAANTLSVKGNTATVKYSKLKKKAQYLKVSQAFKFSDQGEGTKKFTLSSAKKSGKNFKKYFAVNAKTGKVTVKKGLKKGTYKLTVKVTAAGNANYNKATKTVTITVKVK